MMTSYLLPRFLMRRLCLLLLPVTLSSAIAIANLAPSTKAQTPANNQPAAEGRPLTINSDVQEFDSEAGVYTARGNVQIFYPARQIQGTAAQAQYFTKERKIVLSGNVYVLQQGNSIKGETVTYLIDSGQFIANPKPNGQVESVYIIQEQKPNAPNQPSSPAPQTPAFNPKPAPKPPSR